MGLSMPYVPLVVRALAVIGWLGLSTVLCAIADLSVLATCHVRVFYLSAAKMYRWQLSFLKALWHLFRGRKWNVLKERVDSSQYDLGELITGTILFTILVFLMPTTLVYYASFSFFHLLLGAIRFIVLAGACLAAELPLFAAGAWAVGARAQGGRGGLIMNLVGQSSSDDAHAGGTHGARTAQTVVVRLRPRALPTSLAVLRFVSRWQRDAWALACPAAARVGSGGLPVRLALSALVSGRVVDAFESQ